MVSRGVSNGQQGNTTNPARNHSNAAHQKGVYSTVGEVIREQPSNQSTTIKHCNVWRNPGEHVSSAGIEHSKNVLVVQQMGQEEAAIGQHSI